MITPVTFPILGRKADPNYVNVPVDVSQASLFDSMYVHPLMRDTMFLWNYYNVVIRTALWLCTGSYHGYDQWVGGISKERYHASKGITEPSRLHWCRHTTQSCQADFFPPSLLRP